MLTDLIPTLKVQQLTHGVVLNGHALEDFGFSWLRLNHWGMMESEDVSHSCVVGYSSTLGIGMAWG